MKITIGKDNKRLLFEKYFSDEERLTAKGLGMKSPDSGKIICDIRVTCRKALFMFLTESHRNLMVNPGNEKNREIFIKQINGLYKQDAIEFVEKYKPKDLYKDIGRYLNKYQTETIWMTRNRQMSLCAFEQGLGKTVYAASISKLFNLSRTLVICPALVKWNWYVDLVEDWGFNSLGFTILDRDKPMKAIIKESFVVVNYESIDRFFKQICADKVNHIIVDECHMIKNKTTHKFKQVQRVIKKYPKARVTFLSGTPIKNRVTDLYTLLNLSGHPLGSNFAEFKRRYAKGKTKIVGIKNVPDLRLKLSNFIVRKKSEEELDLPELNIKRCYFTMNDQSTKKYNELMKEMYDNAILAQNLEAEVKELKKDIKQGNYNQHQKAAVTSKLKSLTLQLKKANMGKKGNIMTLNRTCAESKVKDIVNLVKQFNKEGEKVVVFSFFKTVLDLLSDEFGGSAVLIDGSVSSIKRRDIIKRFKEDDSVNVFLGQVIAAGIGINLVNASKVIFCDLSFTPDLLEQPYKRLHRQGQKNDVEVMYAMIPDSIDERIYRLIEGKSNDINKAIDHGKKGNVEYGSLEKKLFNNLLQDYEKQNNINKSVVSRFTKVT